MLDLGLVLPNLSYNYVLSGIQSGLPVILKIGYWKPEVQEEINALKALAGNACVKLVDFDIGLGAILQQRIIPGTPLKEMFPSQEEQSIKIMGGVIKDLQSCAHVDLRNFRHVSSWLDTLKKDWDIPQKYLIKSRELAQLLLSTTKREVLLHGDLHHENILLDSNNKWVAIDPKGVIGDPVYEIGAAIRNPIPELLANDDAEHIIQNRVDSFAELLEFDHKRIFDWAYVQAALGACWAIEYGLDAEYFIKFLDIFETIMENEKEI